MVSIGFGGGEVVQVDMELSEVTKLLQESLAERKLMEVVAQNGETVFINAEQVKVIQSADNGTRMHEQHHEELAASA